MRTILAMLAAGFIVLGVTCAYAETNVWGEAPLSASPLTLSVNPEGQGGPVGVPGSEAGPEAAFGCLGCPCGCQGGMCKPCPRKLEVVCTVTPGVVAPHTMLPGTQLVAVCTVTPSELAPYTMAPGTLIPGTVPEPLLPQFGTRVERITQLSSDDVRVFLARALTEFDRLKVGAVQEIDDDTITAEIVTADDSLVRRLEIDRYTGLISPGN
jgi:hypothetical protein